MFGNLGNAVLEAAKQEVPKKTGALRDSLVIERKDTGDNFELTIVEGMWYGRYARGGAKPHWVVAGKVPIPRTQKRNWRGTEYGVPSTYPKAALWWPGLSHPVLRVYQPHGVKENRYDERIADIVSMDADSYPKEFVDSLLAELGK